MDAQAEAKLEELIGLYRKAREAGDPNLQLMGESAVASFIAGEAAMVKSSLHARAIGAMFAD